MIKDTNPDHYKVDGADFAEYILDPKIGEFGDWMFANGYNTGTMAAMPQWISVKDQMPVELHSIFWLWYGKKQWSNAMWREQSDKVLVTVVFKDGTRFVTTGETHDGVWHTAISRTLDPIVTHWMPLPEPPWREGAKE